MRNHFDFPNLDSLVEAEVKNCNDCQLFTKKSTKNPLCPVYVPSKAWEYVRIDFFGPMPAGEHVLVVQDLCTKSPVAVLLKQSTDAKATTKALDEIFNNFGRPMRYRSDSGPPFNSALLSIHGQYQSHTRPFISLSPSKQSIGDVDETAWQMLENSKSQQAVERTSN